MKIFFKKHFLMLVFAGIFLLLSLSSPYFLSKTNLSNILRQGSIVGILTVGQTLVILTGGIDLSLGSLIALSSVLCATFMAYGILFSVLMTILICTLLGSVSGFLVSRVKMAPFIVTLGMLLMARGLAMLIAKGEVVYGVPESFYFIGQGNLIGIPVPALIMVFVVLIILFFLNKTNWGRYIYAVGGNEKAARLFGINVENTKLLVYLLSGFFAGLAGLVYTSRLTAGYCEGGVGYEFDAIGAVVIGGVNLFGGEGSLVKAILGAFILAMINNFMNLIGISPYIQEGMKGAIIIMAVYLNLRGRKQNK